MKKINFKKVGIFFLKAILVIQAGLALAFGANAFNMNTESFVAFVAFVTQQKIFLVLLLIICNFISRMIFDILLFSKTDPSLAVFLETPFLMASLFFFGLIIVALLLIGSYPYIGAYGCIFIIISFFTLPTFLAKKIAKKYY